MKLKFIKTTLLFLTENRVLDVPDGPSLQDCGDLLSWHLSTYLKQSPLEFEGFNRMEFCAVRPDIGDKVHVFDKTAYVNTAFPDIDRIERAKTDTEILEVLEGIVRAGVVQFQSHFGTDLSVFNSRLRELRKNHYVARQVLATRRPRGRDIELRIEAEMTSRVLNVYFVEAGPEGERRRELIQNSAPSAIFLDRRFPKIELDGDRVWLPGKILKPTVPWQRRSKTAPSDYRSKYYEWSSMLKPVR